MGNVKSEVLDILLSVSGLKLDELYKELQGLCALKGWSLESLSSDQLRIIMCSYMESILKVLPASTVEHDFMPTTATVEA